MDSYYLDYTIVFDRLNGESTQIQNGFNLPFQNGFLQFYTDDDPAMASWNSFKGTHSFLWSGLLYDKKRYHLLSPITATNINEELGWVTFSDCVVLEDKINGKSLSFFNSKGRIYAKPSNESLHRNIIDSPCLLPNCLLDGMAECTIGEDHSYAYIVKSSNLKFDVFRVANDEKITSNPLVEYKSAQDYLNPSSPWNKYKEKNIERGLYVFRVYNARYSTEVICFVLPDDAEIKFYSTSKPYRISFTSFANVSSGIIQQSSLKDNSTIFALSNNNNTDSFDFTIGDHYGSISLLTYHPKPQIHVYHFYEEIEIGTQPVLIAFADNINVNYISAKTCSSHHLCEIKSIYKQLFNGLTQNRPLEKITTPIEEQDCLVVRAYTQEMVGTTDAENMTIKLMLLDLVDNTIIEISGEDIMQQAQNSVSATQHDGLLLQSLKDIEYTNIYYAPKFIPKNGTSLVGDAKTDERKQRLTSYVQMDNPVFASDRAYRQFEIACEHRIYFSVFDSLLSMCWNAKKEEFLNTKKKPFKTNIFNFLNGYLKYTTNKSAEPSVAGLKRLAREFLFDWGIIKNDVENSGSQQLKKLYQELINN